MKKIVIIGAGGFGREVASTIESINKKNPTYEILGFLDDGKDYHTGLMINGYPWLGTKEWVLTHKTDVSYVCAIAEPGIKESIMTSFMEQGVSFETIKDPTAFIHSSAEVGPGCVLYVGTMVAPNCKLGAGVLLNSYCTIGHDAEIGDYTYIMPATGISGYCKIGKKVRIGGHSFINPERKIGDGATVAAGSIVFTNVKAGTTVLGNPAKRMKELE